MYSVPLTIALKSVRIGSVQHLLPIVIAISFAIFFIRYSKTYYNEAQKHKAIHVLGCFVSVTVISFHVYQMCFDAYDFKIDLPLYLCSLMAVLIPLFTYYRKYWMFEILVFWIIGGTVQGIITPDIPIGFPSFDFFRYWIVHLGLLVIIFYFIFVFKMKPKLKSIIKSVIALQVYVVLMISINYLLNANYSYLNKKPEAASVLDYFGVWPYYILVCELIIIPLFLIIYLIFRGFKRK